VATEVESAIRENVGPETQSIVQVEPQNRRTRDRTPFWAMTFS